MFATRRRPSPPRNVSTPVVRCGPCCSVEAIGNSTIASSFAFCRSSSAVIRFQSTSVMARSCFLDRRCRRSGGLYTGDLLPYRKINELLTAVHQPALGHWGRVAGLFQPAQSDGVCYGIGPRRVCHLERSRLDEAAFGSGTG